MLTYSTHQIDETRFPQVTIDKLVARGLSHILGNECASKVVAFVEKEAAEGREVSDEAKAAKKLEFQNSMIEAMYNGTLSVRASAGPSLDPVEKVMRQLAKGEVSEILKANGLSFPTKDKTITFGEGDSAEHLSADDLIDRRIANHGDRLRKEAEAEIKRKAREAAKAVEAAKAQGGLKALL